jgi:Tfp pilus assembly protein PilF
MRSAALTNTADPNSTLHIGFGIGYLQGMKPPCRSTFMALALIACCALYPIPGSAESGPEQVQPQEAPDAEPQKGEAAEAQKAEDAEPQKAEDAEPKEASDMQRDYNAKGVALIQEGKLEDAVSMFRSSLAFGELNITYLNLGRTLAKMDRCQDARDAYTKVESAPPVTLPNAAQVKETLKRYRGELEQACRTGLNAKAVALIQEGKREAAVKMFRVSLSFGELNATYLNLGRTLSKLGRCDQAAAAYAKVTSAPPVPSPSPEQIGHSRCALPGRTRSGLQRDADRAVRPRRDGDRTRWRRATGMLGPGDPGDAGRAQIGGDLGGPFVAIHSRCGRRLGYRIRSRPCRTGP